MCHPDDSPRKIRPPLAHEQPGHVTQPIDDAWHAAFNRDWHSVARYRVYRSQFIFGAGREIQQIIQTGLPYDEAKRLETIEQEKLEQEPGYVGGMGAPGVCVELENPDETNREFRRIRMARKHQESLMEAA